MKMIKVKSLKFSVIWMFLIHVLVACTGQNDSQNLGVNDPEESAKSAQNQPVITFDRVKHDFGTIIEGEKVVCYFDYENSGGVELVINSVEASCGCTTPDWSSEPLKTGEQGRLKIIFDAAGRSGVQRKVVTVISNASNSTVRLTLSANIET